MAQRSVGGSRSDTDAPDLAAVEAESSKNREEIERLRERSHEYGNLLQFQAAMLEAMDRKMDGHHDSVKGRISELKAEVKEELTEIKTQTQRTNGRVTMLEKRHAELRGIGIALLALSPVALSFLQRLIA